eukprot:966691-Rhodomonas_salina.1
MERVSRWWRARSNTVGARGVLLEGWKGGAGREPLRWRRRGRPTNPSPRPPREEQPEVVQEETRKMQSQQVTGMLPQHAAARRGTMILAVLTAVSSVTRLVAT